MPESPTQPLWYVSFMLDVHSDRGRNTYGQLGRGDTQDVLDEDDVAATAVDLGGSSASAIAAGEGHVCALLDDASVKVSTYCSSRMSSSGVITTGDDFGGPKNHQQRRESRGVLLTSRYFRGRYDARNRWFPKKAHM